MCPINSIVPVESVKMPDGNDGARRSLNAMLNIGPTNMLLKSGGARRIQVIGSGTEPYIRIIAKEIVKCKRHATANVLRFAGNGKG